MKRILKKIAILLIVLVLIDISFGYLFKKYIFDKTFSGESGGSLNFLLNKKRNIDFLILGTSRAVQQINPDLVTHINGKGHNAGINGTGGIIYNTVLLDICINRGVRPKVIVLQLDAQNFCGEPGTYSSALISLFPFYDESKIMKLFIKKDGFKESLLVKSNLYRFNGKSLNIVFNFIRKPKGTTWNGFEPMEQVMDTTIQVGKIHPKLKLNVDHINFVALYHFNNLCKVNSISLVIVLPPYYKNCLYNERSDAEFTDYIHTKYPNIHLVNLSNINNYKELSGFENWKDYSHLNSIGADKFSRILNDSLAQIETSSPIPINK